MGNLRDVVANVMDCNILIIEFELQLCFYVHFRSNTFGNNINPLTLLAVVK